MTIEQLLSDLNTNIASLNTNIAELVGVSKQLHDLRADAIEKVTTAAKSGGAATKKDKPAETKTEAKPNISTNPEDRKEPGEDIKQLIADYISATDREEERAARKDKVKKLLNHEKIKKPDVSEANRVDHIMDSAIDLFKSHIAKLAAAGDITTPPTAKSDDIDLS